MEVTPNMSDPKTRANRANTVLMILFGSAAVALGTLILAPDGFIGLARFLGGMDLVIYWALVMALMVVLLGLIGRATNRRWLGVLIDSTNTMSLARLQVTLWTILVLSAYLLIALPRVFGMLPIDKLDKGDPMLQQCMEGKPASFVPTMDNCGGGALKITFPPELVLAMGISLASFAGSHLIQNVQRNRGVDLSEQDRKVNDAMNKLAQVQQLYDAAQQASRQPSLDYAQAQQAYAAAAMSVSNPPAGAKAADLTDQLNQAKMDLDARLAVYKKAVDALGQAQADLDAARKALDIAQQDAQAARTEAEGVLHKNASADQASVSEMFRGTEISNCAQVDLSKVQMFFFTVVVLLAYAVATAGLLHSGSAMMNPLGVNFPPFSESLNALLAISHGTYLTAKATVQN